MAKLLYFGTINEILDTDGEHVSLPDNIRDVKALLEYLRNRGDQWDYVFSGQAGNIQITVNKDFATLKHRISNIDEIAFVCMGE